MRGMMSRMKSSSFEHCVQVSCIENISLPSYISCVNWGKLGQRNGIYIHGIRVVMGVRGIVIVGRSSSLA